MRVEAQSDTDLVLAIRCGGCAHQWTAVGSLPAFMLWLKPDRRRNARDYRDGRATRVPSR